MIEDFLRRGYQVTEFGDPADVCVINTCTVTHISDRKSRAMLRRAMRANPGTLVVATGCMAQADAEQLSRLEGIGLVVGNQAKEQIADIVEDYLTGRVSDRVVGLESARAGSFLKPCLYSHQHLRTRAFVKIQDGCQSFCSYCIVPFVRGRVRSKRPEDVVAEMVQLISLGYKEIVLTGIHTGLYGLDLDGWDLERLLEHILAEVDGVYRIRLSSIEPREVNGRMLALMASDPKICRHLHVPLQSGSDRILASMGRSYTGEHYRQLLLKALEMIPGIALTADVMVGYPGETEADFRATCDLLEALPIFELHVFKYSQRAGTRAAAMGGQVEGEVKQHRSQVLLSLADAKKDQFIRKQVGSSLTVLVERIVTENIYTGRSDNYLEVRFASPAYVVGELVEVSLKQACNSFALGCTGA